MDSAVWVTVRATSLLKATPRENERQKSLRQLAKPDVPGKWPLK